MEVPAEGYIFLQPQSVTDDTDVLGGFHWSAVLPSQVEKWGAIGRNVAKSVAMIPGLTRNIFDSGSVKLKKVTEGEQKFMIIFYP